MQDVFIDFPWLQVFVATLAFFMFGALWYSKLLFASTWVRHTGIKMDDAEAKKGVAAIMGGSFVLMLISVFGLAILAQKLELEGGWISGLKLGAVTGICFAATAISVAFIYEKRPLALHLIDGLYMVCGHIIAAIILCVWH